MTGLIPISQAALTLKGMIDDFVRNTFDHPTLGQACKIAELDRSGMTPERASSSIRNEIQNATPIRIPRRQTTRAFFFTLPCRSSNRSGTGTIGNISRHAPPGE
ncbi:hypothetical protein [Bradyrhizobium sp.]|uniref:hypothetical protein n=1 Tax=Bradyrhizobium sp. TaxID=376 RepID=UPI003C77ACD2